MDLDEEDQADLDDLYEQLSDAREQLLGENYTRMLVKPEPTGGGGRRLSPSSRPSTRRLSTTMTPAASIWWETPPATMTCPSPLPGIT